MAAEWIDPNPGLKDYVESQYLVVRWKERKAFLRDEERRLREHNARLGGAGASPVAEALQQIFESVGDKLILYGDVLEGDPDALGRLCDGLAPVRLSVGRQPTDLVPTRTCTRPGSLSARGTGRARAYPR